MLLADIVLPLHLPKPLTYGVTIELQDSIQVGMRVEVNMGKNKLYSGIVIRLHNEKPEGYSVKPIRQLIDHKPIINVPLLKFWKWVHEYYICPLGDVMQAALPAHLKLMSDTLIIWSEVYEEGLPPQLSDKGYLVAEALLLRKQLTIHEIQDILDIKNIHLVISELIDLEVAYVDEHLAEKYKEKTEKFVRLHERYNDAAQLNNLFNELEKKPKHLMLLMAFFQLNQNKTHVLAKTLIEKAQVTNSLLQTLVKHEIFVVEHLSVDRLKENKNEVNKVFDLSPAQLTAFNEIKTAFQTKQNVLLHGVTGSGKTLVYIELIKECIAAGKQVLFLLPEIALTTHIVHRLKDYFGKELGIYHSKFSNNERVEIWKKCDNQEYKVIVGPRSSVWLPFQNLGLIIIDEEHDSSYKQYDPAPRFQARDSAIILANIWNAKVLLGSATPSLETMYNAQQGKFGYVALKERYNNIRLPEIQTANLKNTQTALSDCLTLDLLSGMQDTFDKSKQVILFQNKRGYAPSLMCNSCGWVAHCTNCDVSLTYHKATDKLHCHYCGMKYRLVTQCPSCGNIHVSTKNYGTERIEEDIQKVFPNRKVARMDIDTMRTKQKQETLIADLEKGSVDVLVGTQMVVKGLDIENVALVGIVNADSLLSFPDFRVNERAFQLMEQVSGRAGRKSDDGKVIIQTLKAEHPIIQFVKDHDYLGFYNYELAVRNEYIYPPFTRLIKIVVKHRDFIVCEEMATNCVQFLQKIEKIVVQGPAAPLVPKIRNQFIQEILIKLPKEQHYVQYVKQQIEFLMIEILKLKQYRSAMIYADVDPS